MFNAQDYTARAVRDMQTAATAFGDAGANLQKTIDVAFAATLAANPTLTVDEVSVVIGEVLATFPSVGPRRSWAVALWSNPTLRAALHGAIGEPSLISADDFHAKIVDFCAPLNSRKAYDDAAKAKKAAAKALAATTLAAAAPAPVEMPAPAGDAAPASDPVAVNAMQAGEAIANLLALALHGGEEGEAARLALRDILVNANAAVEEYEAADMGEEAQRAAA